MQFSPKDPQERVTLTFNFSALLSAITAVEVDCSVAQGVDAGAAALLDGAAVTSGAIVYQGIKAGLDGVLYRVRCKATGPEGVFVLVGQLPVVTEL